MARRSTPPSYHQGFAHNASESAYLDLWKGLVGSWAASLGPVGVSLRDLSGFGNDGMASGIDHATAWVIGANPRQPGYTLDHDGTDAFWEVSASNDGNWESNTRGTILVTFRSDSLASGDRLVTYGGNAATLAGLFSFQVSDETGLKLLIIQRSDGEASAFQTHGDTIIAENTWYRAALVSDGAAWSIYLNGSVESLTVKEGSNDGDWFGDTAVTAASATRIGALRFNGTNIGFWDGPISDVQIYDRPLNATEIALDYQVSLATLRLRERITIKAVAAAGGLSIPVAMHEYRQRHQSVWG